MDRMEKSEPLIYQIKLIKMIEELKNETKKSSEKKKDLIFKILQAQAEKEGLMFGEVLDIVGKRGGYNFNFAWASGMIAGKEMVK